MQEPKYKRIVLKLSGEALAGEGLRHQPPGAGVHCQADKRVVALKFRSQL